MIVPAFEKPCHSNGLAKELVLEQKVTPVDIISIDDHNTLMEYASLAWWQKMQQLDWLGIIGANPTNPRMNLEVMLNLRPISVFRNNQTANIKPDNRFGLMKIRDRYDAYQEWFTDGSKMDE